MANTARMHGFKGKGSLRLTILLSQQQQPLIYNFLEHSFEAKIQLVIAL